MSTALATAAPTQQFENRNAEECQTKMTVYFSQPRRVDMGFKYEASVASLIVPNTGMMGGRATHLPQH
jgi:hypothetical protein